MGNETDRKRVHANHGTEGYLPAADQTALIAELESYGLYNISLSGTTMREVNYGDRIYLKISGTYNENVLALQWHLQGSLIIRGHYD